MLFGNETMAVKIARSLDEGARFVIEGDPNRIDPANEGKLVYVSGELKTTAQLRPHCSCVMLKCTSGGKRATEA